MLHLPKIFLFRSPFQLDLYHHYSPKPTNLQLPHLDLLHVFPITRNLQVNDGISILSNSTSTASNESVGICHVPYGLLSRQQIIQLADSDDGEDEDPVPPGNNKESVPVEDDGDVGPAGEDGDIGPTKKRRYCYNRC